jgi:hypothetical protein
MADGVEAIQVVNASSVDMATFTWRVDYDGGESAEQQVVGGGSGMILLDDCPGLKPNQECWPLVHPILGESGRCGTNVAFSPRCGLVGTYKINAGAVVDCDYQGAAPS